MITLPAKFEAENNKAQSKPTVLLKLGNSVLENIQSSEGDWGNNSFESQVDYATIEGSVTIERDPVPDEEQTSNDASVGLRTSTGSTVAWQSFKQLTGASKTLESVKMYFNQGSSVTGDYSCGIYDAKSGSLVASSPVFRISSAMSDTSLTFDFSDSNFTVLNNTEYWVACSAALVAGSTLSILSVRYNTAGGYANGQLDTTGESTLTDIGDLKFTLSLSGDYFLTSGSIVTQIIDLGEVPTVDGEWKFLDITPSDYGTTGITYIAQGSTDNFVASSVTIGTVIDGGAIESGNWYRYYKIIGALTTTDKSESPTLQSMGLSFVTYSSFQRQGQLEYEQSLKSISSLTTEISDFDLVRIGQMTVTLAQTEQTTNFFYSVYAKNKPAKILLGFVADGFLESDYIEFYSGVIDKWPMSGRDITVTIKDNSTNWAVDIPQEETAEGEQAAPSYGSSLVASDDHPIDVMLDILQNQLAVRDSTINIGSFNAVKALLSGWLVTRTVAGADQVSADELLNQLRILTGTYFIPQPNGQIFLKLYDESETVVADILQREIQNRPSWDPNMEDLINRTFVEWDYSGGTFGAVYIGFSETSYTNNGEVGRFDFEDYWTVDDVGNQGLAQQEDLRARILKRYKNPPPILKFKMDRKKLTWEVGDQVTITTDQAPSSDRTGIVEQKYQIIKKNFGPLGSTIDFTFLRVYT